MQFSLIEQGIHALFDALNHNQLSGRCFASPQTEILAVGLALTARPAEAAAKRAMPLNSFSIFFVENIFMIKPP